MIEIEIKLKVDNFEPVIEKLKALGAEFEGDYLQCDSYYDDLNDTLVNSDRCLRIRRHINHLGESLELTYKGARENHRFKSRREIGIKVEKAAELAELFKGLGYKKRLTLEKKRSLWDFANCKVALDELPLLGKYIEIEGPSEEDITSAQTQLSLENLQHTPESYAHLMENAIKTKGLDTKHVTFETA